jgi:hypothetical protein
MARGDRVELTCGTCGTNFNRLKSQVKGKEAHFCNMACSRARYGKNLEGLYKKSSSPGHPLGSRVSEHRIILYRLIGPGEHPCHWCRTPVSWTPGGRTREGSLVVDHLDGDRKNNAPENLAPSCHGCNCNRSRKDLIADGDVYVTFGNGRRQRARLGSCLTCGVETRTAVSARAECGRFCSHSCRSKWTMKNRREGPKPIPPV